jgi:hypothetical protein
MRTPLAKPAPHLRMLRSSDLQIALFELTTVNRGIRPESGPGKPEVGVT